MYMQWQMYLCSYLLYDCVCVYLYYAPRLISTPLRSAGRRQVKDSCHKYLFTHFWQILIIEWIIFAFAGLKKMKYCLKVVKTFAEKLADQWHIYGIFVQIHKKMCVNAFAHMYQNSAICLNDWQILIC